MSTVLKHARWESKQAGLLLGNCCAETLYHCRAPPRPLFGNARNLLYKLRNRGMVWFRATAVLPWCLTTSTSRGKKQVPEWFKDRISNHTAAGLLSTFSCFYSFSSCSKRRTSLCVCVLPSKIHMQNQWLKFLKTLVEIFRSLWSIISLLRSLHQKGSAL